MGSMTGRTALVTGAARGQGEVIARRFAAEGANVMVTDVLDEGGRSVAESIGGATAHAMLDVTDEEGWRAVVAATVERFGRLDALVNNAGVLRFGPLTDTSLADFRSVMDVNVVGTFLGIRSCATALRASGGGTIVNTASIAGTMGIADLGAYVASKFAIRGLTRTAALELADWGIRVNAVLPGRIDTAMGNPAGADDPGAGIPLGRIGRSDDVAEAVLFLSSAASSFCTGSELTVDGGATAGAGRRWQS